VVLPLQRRTALEREAGPGLPLRGDCFALPRCVYGFAHPLAGEKPHVRCMVSESVNASEEEGQREGKQV
jgi:hypothetical protein